MVCTSLRTRNKEKTRGNISNIEGEWKPARIFKLAGLSLWGEWVCAIILYLQRWLLHTWYVFIFILNFVFIHIIIWNLLSLSFYIYLSLSRLSRYKGYLLSAPPYKQAKAWFFPIQIYVQEIRPRKIKF